MFWRGRSIQALTRLELVNLFRRLGLPTHGRKDALLRRMRAWLLEDTGASEEERALWLGRAAGAAESWALARPETASEHGADAHGRNNTNDAIAGLFGAVRPKSPDSARQGFGDPAAEVRRLPLGVREQRGAVYACGLNSHGQLGLGHTHDAHVPTLIPLLAGLEVTQVAAGADVDVVVATTRRFGAYSWGGGAQGAAPALGVQRVTVEYDRLGRLTEVFGAPLKRALEPQRLRRLDGAWGWGWGGAVRVALAR